MTNSQIERLRPLLEAFFKRPHHHRTVYDPVAIPHRRQDPEEIEVVGWLTALFAYGRAPFFNRTIEAILSLSNGSFYRYLRRFNLEKERSRFRGIYYRFARPDDILALVYLTSCIVRQYGGIKPLFLQCRQEGDKTTHPALSRFVAKITSMDTQPVYKTAKKPPGLLHFFPSPDKGSACKRLHLYLRWMVRPEDGIDFGLWKEIPPASLIVPLDTHMARIGRYLGLTSRKTADLKMAIEITENLKHFDPEDPLKYDFPLCHLGISQDCPTRPNRSQCQVCLFLPACKQGRKMGFRRPAKTDLKFRGILL